MESLSIEYNAARSGAIFNISECQNLLPNKILTFQVGDGGIEKTHCTVIQDRILLIQTFQNVQEHDKLRVRIQSRERSYSHE